MDKKINLITEEAQTNVDYREGTLPESPNEVRLNKHEVIGSTGTVYKALTSEPLKSRLTALLEKPEKFFDDDILIKYDLDQLVIQLQVSFNKSDGLDIYESRLKTPEIFRKFGINEDVVFGIKGLTKLIKMNRSHFERREEAMSLVSELQNFKAKVNKELENLDDDRGNKRYLRDQVVESNIPKSFNLFTPLFIGCDYRVINVEILIDPDTYELSLISPALTEYQQETSEEIINEEIKKIESDVPQIKVFNIT